MGNSLQTGDCGQNVIRGACTFDSCCLPDSGRHASTSTASFMSNAHTRPGRLQRLRAELLQDCWALPHSLIPLGTPMQPGWLHKLTAGVQQCSRDAAARRMTQLPGKGSAFDCAVEQGGVGKGLEHWLPSQGNFKKVSDCLQAQLRDEEELSNLISAKMHMRSDPPAFRQTREAL